jgi:aryl-alcohol dehydrogenase-like predicted oxidoreductase
VKLAQWYIKRAAEEAAKNSGNSHFVYAPTLSLTPRAIMWLLLLAMALQVTGVVNWGALVDGVVAGTWKRAIKKKRVLVETHLFAKQSKAAMMLIEDAANRFAHFLGLELELKHD